MIVVARNNGLSYDSIERGGLKEGKVYDVIQWSYQDHTISPGHWINRNDDFLNPKEPKFFIKVINEYGEESEYWNDYSLSSEEMRDIKIDKILE